MNATARPTARERSLRIFVIVSFGFAAWRVLLALAFLAFGPPLPGELPLTEAAFVLSKAFLGGLFWPISFAIEGWSDPLSWLLFPW